MTIPCFKSLHPVAALLMATKWCWVHGDMVVSTKWRSPRSELPFNPPPPHLRYRKTPQRCFLGDCRTRSREWFSTIKQEKLEKKTYDGHSQQVLNRTSSRLKEQLPVRSTPKFSMCESLHCGHYNLDLQCRLTIVTMLQLWYMSVLAAPRNCLCVFVRLWCCLVLLCFQSLSTVFNFVH